MRSPCALDGDPVVFLPSWKQPAATAEKVRNGWLGTGDLAEVDEDGYYRFVGRTDDLNLRTPATASAPARSRSA